MLLFSKIAAPKAPKRRSRAGCTFCKEKKKKCDETRPRCARCVEKDLCCTYEAIRPRQRRRREFQAGYQDDAQDDHESIADDERWPESEVGIDDKDIAVLSPVEDSDGGLLTFSFPPDVAEHALTPQSPVASDAPEDMAGESSTELVQRSTIRSIASQPISLPPDLAMIAPCPVGSPLIDFHLPAFSEFSEHTNRRGLVDHFCNVISHRIVFREESGNPFQQLVLPLSYKSSPVMNAIYALASAHLEYRGVNTGSEKSLYFHNEAIQGLAQLIERGDKGSHKNELLAAIMLLVYYEVLVQKGRANIVDGHLKGALTIMNSCRGDSSPTSVFLERAFGFYDVITALSLGTAPLSSAPATGYLFPFPPLYAPPASPFCNVDTLLGMATTLWPIIHRLSNLLSLKEELENATRSHQGSKVAVLRMEFEATSQAIETALKQWKPCLPPNATYVDDTLNVTDGDRFPEHPQLESILHSAMAYRHSAFVYLYRTIWGYPSDHELVQKHAHTSLVHCVKTVELKGPRGALLWPLFAAACEAISINDRLMAEQTFREIEMHQGMLNIEKAWGVVREVWNQLDLLSVTPYGAKDVDLWRRVSKEMGVSIVFG